ncbi:AtzE family amidohydrolase [Chelatococcus reniformis]|uniref:Amidase n=1 Tax=Chelatococcus reniformis TaxID=1494448 RepID=A0A916UIR0_9HYPH|nr:AtzE family amidohydrolase [Chelatococcus reniformis]GGC74430.1 amidase [Chelatococcus reniformis]
MASNPPLPPAQSRDHASRAAVAETLRRIERLDPLVNAFTDVTAERANRAAEALDAGRATGPLAGVPFAVKNLFDIAGLPTRAGSRINRDRAPAERDSPLISRLEAAGAILVGALNMGEYAYDFTGENVHDGHCHNPHALDHMAGGSSSGAGAAVAAGLVPLALGSDTNGSIRVPAAFCGVFGLKPTFGRLSRAASFPFVTSLDHLGPFARSVRLLAGAYDAMQGPDADDPTCTARLPEPSVAQLDDGPGSLRIAVAGGYFATGGDADAYRAVAAVAAALGASRTIDIPEAARARAAAYLITASEGAALHLDRLRSRPADFDPAVRDRLIAGAMMPASWVNRAHRFRRWYGERFAELFKDVDIILAPSTPCRAPKLGQTTLVFGGQELPLRPNIGVYTQPISFAGLPVAAVPVFLDGGLPLGVQVIGAPWREDSVLRIAAFLEREGVAAAPIAALG